MQGLAASRTLYHVSFEACKYSSYRLIGEQPVSKSQAQKLVVVQSKKMVLALQVCADIHSSAHSLDLPRALSLQDTLNVQDCCACTRKR